jgi:hypothetical protein
MTAQSSSGSWGGRRALSAASSSAARTAGPQSPSRRRTTPTASRSRRLTCPHLVAALARVEAAGGVERWSQAVVEDPALRRSLDGAHEEQRRVRRGLAAGASGKDGGASLGYGIGGTRNPHQLKCLHAHAAFALARPGYELGERILREVEPLWPPDGCCTD